jgi:hypothetical protein
MRRVACSSGVNLSSKLSPQHFKHLAIRQQRNVKSKNRLEHERQTDSTWDEEKALMFVCDPTVACTCQYNPDSHTNLTYEDRRAQYRSGQALFEYSVDRGV